MLFEQLDRNGAGSGTEAPIGLLKGDDVGPKLVEDVDRPFRTPPPIGADRLADIVARYADHRGAGVESRALARKPALKSVGPFVVEPAKRVVERLGGLVRCRRDGVLDSLG